MKSDLSKVGVNFLQSFAIFAILFSCVSICFRAEASDNTQIVSCSSLLVSPISSSVPVTSQRFADPHFTIESNGKVSLKLSKQSTLKAKVANLVVGPIAYHSLGIKKLSGLLDRISKDSRTDVGYFRKLKDAAQIEHTEVESMAKEIPKTGALIVYAPHMLDGLTDGVNISDLVESHREKHDVKIVLNRFLEPVPGLKENAILVDVTGDAEGRAYNKIKFKEMEDHLASGGVLVIFPSGETAVKKSSDDAIAVDGKWKNTFVRMARNIPGTQLLPIFPNQNPSDKISFVAKYLAPLKQPMIIRSMSENMGSTLELHIGKSLPISALENMSDEDAVKYLRARAFAMADANPRWQRDMRIPQDLSAPISENVLAAELQSAPVVFDFYPDKPEKAMLTKVARGREIPKTVLEIGRLREESFRETNEGTGFSHDNDSFDYYYNHIIVLNKKTDEIAGSMRFIRMAEVLERHTQDHNDLYLSGQFDISDLLYNDRLDHAIEMTRTFVASKFKKKILAAYTLPALFSTIGAEVVRSVEQKDHRKSVRDLMGGVSVPLLSDNSLKLIVEYYKKNFMSEDAIHVRAVNPPKFKSVLDDADFDLLLSQIHNFNDLQAAIREIEQDPEFTLPPLLQIYASMGAKSLAFSIDKDFGSLDILIKVDLTQTPIEALNRYMGEEGAAKFLEYWKTHKDRPHGLMRKSGSF